FSQSPYTPSHRARTALAFTGRTSALSKFAEFRAQPIRDFAHGRECVRRVENGRHQVCAVAGRLLQGRKFLFDEGPAARRAHISQTLYLGALRLLVGPEGGRGTLLLLKPVHSHDDPRARFDFALTFIRGILDFILDVADFDRSERAADRI